MDYQKLKSHDYFGLSIDLVLIVDDLVNYFDRLSTDDGDDAQRRSTTTKAEMGDAMS